MKYVISDVHGNYEKYQKMLKKLDLKPDDVLYVLGDVIDRRNDGFKILRAMEVLWQELHFSKSTVLPLKPMQ